jgi:AcrR family transcriptional regulator
MKAEPEFLQDITGSARFAHMLKQMPAVLDAGQPVRRKGEATRMAIVTRALQIACTEGLERVSFGTVAEHAKMARSGVFAHFRSRDNLLLAILDLYDSQFRNSIFLPALKLPRGLPRLEAMFSRWTHFCINRKGSDCILLSASMTGPMEAGPVRDRLTEMVLAWQEALCKCIGHAIDEGHLPADTDAAQLGYELYGLVLALHQQARFLGIAESSRHAANAFGRLVGVYWKEGGETTSRPNLKTGC